MLVGLTGCFGSGKSTVLKIFESLGATTIDADSIVHGLLREDSVKKLIRERFGQAVFKGPFIDRNRLARKIFDSEQDRKALEAILHPLVFEYVRRFAASNPDRIVVAEIPLLFEAGDIDDFDAVITVSCAPDTIRKRLMEKGFDAKEIEKRLGAQMPLHEKVKRSDFVLENSGSIREIREQAERIWQEITGARGGSSATSQ
jgi:dephospho-CoA kinase